MQAQTTTVSVAGSQMPAYFMGRPREAYVKAFSARAAIHEIKPEHVAAGSAQIAA